MDRDQNTSSAPKKRFTPKAPKRKPKPPINPKIEAEDNDDGAATDEAAKALLQRVNEHLGKRGHKNEKKSSVQVAFSNRVASSGQIRSFGKPREGYAKTNSSGSNSETCVDEEKISISSPSSSILDGNIGSEYAVESSDKKKKAYREPWDYNHSYYPITLPLRPPYSGDPELLDESEFGGAAMDYEYNENTVNPALELGLLEENDEPRILFLQLPTTLSTETPQEKRLATTPQKDKGKKKVGTSRPPLGDGGKGREKMGEIRSLGTGLGLKNLTKENTGKWLVYKSGAIKWKIGEVVYDVTPGVRCNFAQDLVAMNTAEKHAYTLAEVGKRAVVTPNIESFLENNLNLGPF